VPNGTHNIEVRSLGGLTPAQEAAFTSASDRWSHLITPTFHTVSKADSGWVDELRC
jgi:hypothetical protein